MTTATVNQPEAVEAVKFYTDFYKNNLSPDSTLSNDGAANRRLFIAGILGTVDTQTASLQTVDPLAAVHVLTSGVPNAIEVFRELKAKGHKPGGVRIDSGDLGVMHPDGYVELLYQRILGRPAEAAGRDWWAATIEAGSPRSTVVRRLVGTAESRGRRVDALYVDLLGRSADGAGRAFWVDRLARVDDLDLTATLGIDTSLRDVSLTAPLAGFTHGLAKYGTGTLGYLVSGPTESGPLAVREGTLNLGPASALTLPAPAAISVSPSLGRTGFLNLPGGASLATEDLGQGVSQPALYAGTTGRGVVTLTNTASASVGRLDVGRETGSAGIIRLAAGTRLHSRSGTGNTGLVGINNGSYGCIQNDGGTVTNNGDVVFGLAAGSCGIYRQTAGAFATAGGTVAPAGTQGGYYGGLTYIGRSGTGHAYISGGSFVQHGGNQIHMGSRDTVNGGLAVLTVDGDASVSADRIDCCANNPDSRVLINLLGGTLSLRYIWRSAQAGSAAAVNFNGGTFRVPNNPATLFQGGASCLIYPGGGTIDTAGLYAGFIWNRSSTNETWSFAESIDDNVMLVLDGETLINDGRWDGTTVATRTVAPGPHAIELRVYNNTGGAGPVAQDGWTATDWGFGVDRLGRGLKDTACYERLLDPGDGSLLTVNTNAAAIRAEVRQGTLRLTTGARPGLYAAQFTNVEWSTTSPVNPRNAVELGATLANSPKSQWTAKHLGIYTGVIWNRSPTNETWNFAESIDDNVWLSLDGEVVINNTVWNATTVSTNVISPGPHAIELRVYNASGIGGPAAEDGWTTKDWGFGVDRLGRGLKDTACYEPLIDPGDGSFLTTGTIEDDPFQDVPVDIAPGAALDLNGIAQCVQFITGGGTVTNGALAAGSVLSPGGDDATGTLTLSDVTLGAVVYRATLRDAAADVLAFTQPVDLSALVIVPSDALSLAASGRDYIIATAPSFTGTRPVLSGFPSRWKVIVRGTELHLTALGGTCLTIL